MQGSEKPSPMPRLAKPTAEELVAFTACLGPLIDICKPPLTARQIEVYFGLMSDLPAAAVGAAAIAIASDRVYPSWPTPGEIRAKAIELTAAKESRLQWGEAWTVCLQAARRWGINREQEAMASLPPVVAKAMQAFGWRRFCNVDERDRDTATAQFRDIYSQIAQRELREESMPVPVKGFLADVREKLAAKLDGRNPDVLAFEA